MDPFSNKIYAKHLDVKIGFFVIDWVTDILFKKIKEKPLINSENIVNQSILFIYLEYVFFNRY